MPPNIFYDVRMFVGGLGSLSAHFRHISAAFLLGRLRDRFCTTFGSMSELFRSYCWCHFFNCVCGILNLFALLFITSAWPA